MTLIQVALIEDHDLTRMGLRTTLSQAAGMKVIGEAANGIEGLKLLLRAKPDVALVDIGLPGIDGIELMRQFKQALSDTPSEAVPTKVLMLTLQDHEATVLAAFAAGADSYCMKDVAAEQLLQAVQSTAEGNHWLDPAIARVVLQHNQRQVAQAAERVAKHPTVTIASDSEYSDVLAAAPLTSRELEILALIVAGSSNADIANQCYISVGTVKTHVRNILNKLSVDDRTQAAVRALRAGLVV